MADSYNLTQEPRNAFYTFSRDDQTVTSAEIETVWIKEADCVVYMSFIKTLNCKWKVKV